MDIKTYWNNRYELGRTSGNGSYGEELEKKLKLLAGLPITSIVEIGCGDFNFGKHLLELYPQATYTGFDISDVIINKNRELYPQHSFYVVGETPIPRADLLLCVDVLFHVLDDQEYYNLLEEIRRHWTKYLAITNYEVEENTASHVKIRDFDYKTLGDPFIRKIVEVDGSKYFYLFKRHPIDLHKVSCCLNTKESFYPQVILDEIAKFPFGEVLINTDSNSPHRKQEVFSQAKFEYIYYQDDDCIAPIKELVELSEPNIINVAMKPGHFEGYKNKRMTQGLGWGAIFPKALLKSLDKYIDKYGEDELYRREDTRIFTYLNYPQNRLVLPITDLPSATAPDRLWRQPKHYDYISIVEERCRLLL